MGLMSMWCAVNSISQKVCNTKKTNNRVLNRR
jgi:hypothetical protein